MAKSPSEQIRELVGEVAILREPDAARRRELDILQEDLRRQTDELKDERETRHRLQNEVTEVKQQLQDHIKHTELSDAQRWALIVALLGAVLSLASGLIVSLVRK